MNGIFSEQQTLDEEYIIITSKILQEHSRAALANTFRLPKIS